MTNTAETKLRMWVGTLAIVGATATGLASAGMTQVRFDVPQPFEVGGRVFSAGVITIHELTAYTPSRTLLEVWVDGTCIGMVTANTAGGEAPSRRDEALFRRGDGGRLVMVGYRVAGLPAGRTYRFEAGNAPTDIAQQMPGQTGGVATALVLFIR